MHPQNQMIALTWLVTIDFGDGECDEWATKIWDGESKVFSMKK